MQTTSLGYGLLAGYMTYNAYNFFLSLLTKTAKQQKSRRKILFFSFVCRELFIYVCE
jgi:hypothetical protein